MEWFKQVLSVKSRSFNVENRLLTAFNLLTTVALLLPIGAVRVLPPLLQDC